MTLDVAIIGGGIVGISTGPASARRLADAIPGNPVRLASLTDPARFESPFPD